MAAEVDFTDDEIREELANLGYYNVPQDKLEDFKKDLLKLISSERSKTNSLNCSSLTEIDTEEDRKTRLSPTDGLEYSRGIASNHGNRWMEKDFKEDWHYQGERSVSLRPQTAPAGQLRQTKETACDYDAPLASAAFERNQSHNYAESDAVKRCMKRKTSRRTQDGCRMIDESFTTDTDSETAGIYEIYEKIKNLAMRECECGKSRPKSGDVEPPYRIKGRVNSNPSVIKANKEPPHTRNLVRTNRTARLRMYEKCWKAQPAIGEDHRHSLRKAVRVKLLQQFDVQIPQKVYVPNLYVPPHEKDRVNLRWNVRRACQNYEMPNHGFYHEI